MSGEGRPARAARAAPRAPDLTERQQRLIHAAACEILAAVILRRAERLPDPTLGGAADITLAGAFVTLKRQGRLRACCGALGGQMPLNAALRQAAVRTAAEDVRLPAISPSELPFLDVDVSLLHSFAAVDQRGRDRLAAVEVGRHGLQIRRGSATGLLLPSVATEHGYEAEEFLRQVCRKADLPTVAWEDDATILQTFEAHVIGGPFDPKAIGEGGAAQPVVTAEEVQRLADHCASNLAALLEGKTPSYYLPGGSDGSVHGVALTLKLGDRQEAIHFMRLSLRPGMPLQSTLFSLTEAAADAVKSGRVVLSPGNAHIELSVLHDPAMHGTVAEPDLRGVDPGRRALLVTEGTKSGWVSDPQRTPEQLLQAAAEAARVFNPEAAQVYSLAIVSTEPSVRVSSVPRPMSGAPVRATAVAGTFYPASAAQLAKMVDGFLGEGESPPEPWPAILVPHAGLIYSGRIAAQVYRRVKIPDRVIVLGPKHTRLGMEWAVAPHERWALPGSTLAGDPELARRLAEAIPGLALDAAAHLQEHSIEVQLPFLARLAPQGKVVGIAIGGGNLARCRQFAAGLARVLGELQPAPLLVVSSDMNHYARDADNRRLDQIAMAAIERLNPEGLYLAVTRHGISMCGLLPAVIAMETLRQLGGLKECRRVAYGTSGEVTGDSSRVVGYAGMLLR